MTTTAMVHICGANRNTGAPDRTKKKRNKPREHGFPKRGVRTSLILAHDVLLRFVWLAFSNLRAVQVLAAASQQRFEETPLSLFYHCHVMLDFVSM